MSEKEILQTGRFKFSEKREISGDFYQRKPYKKPILEPLNTSADIIAGASTSNQLEHSNGLIGS